MPYQKNHHWRFVKTLAGIIAASALGLGVLSIPPGQPDRTRERVDRGEYFEKLISDYTNPWDDYLFATRLRRNGRMHGWGENGDLIQEWKNLTIDFRQPLTRVSHHMRGYIADNNELIETIKKLNRTKNRGEAPAISSSFDRLPQLSQWEHIAQLLAIEGKIKEIDNDYDGAYDNYYNILQFSSNTTGGSLPSGLAGIAINHIALDSIYCSLGFLDESQLRKVIENLGRAESEFAYFDEVIGPELEMNLNDMDYIFRRRGNLESLGFTIRDDIMGFPIPDYIEETMKGLSGIPGVKNIAPNLAWCDLKLREKNIRANAEEVRGKIMEYAKAPYASADERELEEYIFNEETGIGMKYWPTSMTIPSLKGAKDAWARCYAVMRVTKLNAALLVYKLEHGVYPDSIDELVEERIIKKMPIDPFSGEPFQYSDGNLLVLP